MSRKVPLGIQDLVAKNQDAGKPKVTFLSKAERQKLALEKREAEVRAKREQPLPPSALPAPPPQAPPPRAPALAPPPPPPSAPAPTPDALLTATRYLGAKVPDKRRRLNSKKFVFDWDQTDDTLRTEGDPLYTQRIGPKRPLGGSVDLVRRKKPAAETHWSKKPLADMTERDWRIFKEDYSISVRGGTVPHPLRSWTESTIPRSLLSVIDEIGYAEPSAIQRQAIPIGLERRDIIGIAETGSGKTAAFVIPMLAYILDQPPLNEVTREQGPFALVLAPTRELAQQIESETNRFVSSLGFRCVSIVGGRDIGEQQTALSQGAEIVIATPGRLQDCLERHILVLSQCSYVVMDEADRMVSLGFEEVLNFILDSLPPGERQTIMFSATMPPPVERLAKAYLKNPAYVTIGVAGQAVDTVEQRVEFVAGEDRKKKRLLEILNSRQFRPPIIVFVNTKKQCDVLQKELQRARWHAATLHSGKNQEQRELALQSLRDGSAGVLVATDLAGRGIDVSDVSLVINFDMANHIEAYIHRIGRTGRAGKRGTAITFLTDSDQDLFYDLKSEITKSPVSKCPSELSRHPAAQTKVSYAMKKRAAEFD